MSITTEDEELYNEFHKRFPLEKMKTISLEEYTNLEKNSFCYWVENKLNNWGNIHGATSYKFGIYRWNKEPEKNKTSILADDKYAWQDRFGKSPEEAFENVRNKIVKIIEASKNQDYKTIDDIDISEMFKWKIAFLYSEKKLINWFSRASLFCFAKYLGKEFDENTPTSYLQSFLMKKKGDKSLEVFSEELLPIWKKYKQEINGNDIYEGNKMTDNDDTIEQYKFLLLNSHNLILHGTPGTGKTYLAREIAEAMSCSENEVGFVQFHPSYDYTDFVEGLRPVKDNSSGQIGFERKDGVFKRFCERALKNLKDSNKTVDDLLENFKRDLKDKKEIIVQSIRSSTEFSVFLNNDKIKVRISNGTIYPTSVEKIQRYLESQEYDELHDTYDPAIGNYILNNYTVRSDIPFVFIIDEINRGEMSKIFGELFFAIEPSYRGAEKCKDLRTQYSNLQNEPNAFDEILKITDSDNFGHFFIPENVYIIGTMNDIDRNVESMDFAFRRRFTFKEITAKDTQEQILSELDDSIRDEAIQRMDSLNNAISKVERLSSAYHIGGAYFLKLKYLDNDFGKLWEYHLEGLLREYLRGMENAEDELKKLEEAYKNDNLMEEKQNLHE